MWSLILSFLPWTGLATFLAALYYARKASKAEAQVSALKSSLSTTEYLLEQATLKGEQYYTTIKNLTYNYEQASRRQASAEAKADALMAHSEELAAKVLKYQSAEEAARATAEALQQGNP